MIIRTAKENEYGSVRAFYHDLIDKADEAGYRIGWQKDVYPSPELLRGSISNGELYVGLEDGRVIAAMILNHECNESYSKFDWQTDAKPSEILLIHALGVHPDFKRRGHAKELVSEAIRVATAAGCKAMRLDVLEGNTAAEALYTGFGFKYMATLDMFYEDTGWTAFRLFELVL